jgi:hypothetical protein
VRDDIQGALMGAELKPRAISQAAAKIIRYDAHDKSNK